MIHQYNTTTEYNRYPEIFTWVKELIDPETILSFGCSVGEEIATLNEIYFPYADITGVDVNSDAIAQCRQRFDGNANINVSETITGKFDVIFAMSVLCRWENTKDLLDCSQVYQFSLFESQLIELDQHLNKGGLLIIYNANFRFKDTCLYRKYEVAETDLKESGFVHKFNAKNIRISSDYKEVIFIKK